MTDNDYVILVDENGTPYIAHGERYQRFKNNLKNSRAVKYLARFPNFYGMGKTAYAYTEQQLRNLRNGGRKAATAVQNTAKKAAKYVDDHDAGLTEAIGARAAQRRVNHALHKGDTEAAEKNARQAYRLREQSRREYNNSGAKRAADTIEKYGKTSLAAVRRAGQNTIDRINKEGEKAGALAKRAGHAAKTAGRRVGQFIDDHDMGITERVQANRMSKRARELESEGRLTLDGAERNKTMAAQLYREAGRLRAQGRQEYENSIVGKAGNAAKNAASSASAAVKNAGKSASAAIGAKTAEIGNAIEKVSGKAAKREYDKAQEELEAAWDVYNTAFENYQNVSPGKGNNVGAEMKAEKELKAAEEALHKANDTMLELAEEYDKSPYGIAEAIMDEIDIATYRMKENRRVKKALKTGERSGR